MLNFWLSPVSVKNLLQNKKREAFPLLKHIKIYETGKEIPSLKKTQIAIIGWDEKSNIVRKCWYQLEWHFKGVECVDLGIIKNNKDGHSLSQLLLELIESNILPIIIGGEEVQATPQFLAHKGLRIHSNIGIISKSLSLSYIDNLRHKYKNSIFNIGYIGYQTYLCSPEQLNAINENKYDGIRLGDIQHRIEEVEPIIRDVDMIFFQLDAIRGSDAMAVPSVSPNGLRAEEACQLARYAGMSNKLCSFSISGFQPQNDIRNLTAQVIAQMIWHFIDGFYNRQSDYPIDTSDMTEYIVPLKSSNINVTFWKSNKSGRWWMQIPSMQEKKLDRHSLAPCSYNDYQNAIAGKFPERLFTALQR